MRSATFALLLLLSGCSGMQCTAVGGGAIGGGSTGYGALGGGAVGGPVFGAADGPPGSPAFWLDGQDIDGNGTDNSAYTDNDPVTTWADSGSLGLDVTQATASAKPTYKDGAGPGSTDSVSFDGGDSLARASAEASFKFLHDGTGSALYAVASIDGANPNSRQVLVDTYGLTGSTVGAGLIYDDRAANSQSNTVVVVVANGNGSSFPVISQVDDTFVSATWDSVGITHGSSQSPEWVVHVNGTTTDSGSYAFTPSTSNPENPLTIGKDSDAAGEFLTGDLAEVLAYSSYDDATARAAVQDYFDTRYDTLPE